jgi:hypothetical protein
MPAVIFKAVTAESKTDLGLPVTKLTLKRDFEAHS